MHKGKKEKEKETAAQPHAPQEYTEQPGFHAYIQFRHPKVVVLVLSEP
jgi:hypothetical protein